MGLRFSILASGSTGNAMVVSNGERSVLVDAGLSGKRIDQLLAEREVAASSIDGIFITHEHADHIRGLGPFSRKYNLPIYANEGTWAELNRHVGQIPEENRRVMPTGSSIHFDGLEVESYGISHDANEPVGYCFHYAGKKLSLATDLGYMSGKVKEKIQDSDVLILESNHDVSMLRMGKYPWNIKRRILGDTGHLSNEAAGEGLCEVLGERTRRVYLAHLSRDHNLMDLARMTVEAVLQDNRIYLEERNLKLMDTYFDRATPWDEVGSA